MPFTLQVVNAPASEPLSASEAKEHLRVSSADQDTVIGNQIKAAREYCEGVLNRQLMPATLKFYLDLFPCHTYWLERSLERDESSAEAIIVPRPPFISITPDATYTTLGIQYVDTAGSTQTISASDYRVDSVSEPARITPAYGSSWPSARYVVNAISVTYRAGYANAAAVPFAIKQAMLMLIGHWYEQRESVVVGSISKEVEFAVHALLQPYRVDII